MPVSVIFHVAAQTEFVSARRCYAARASESIAESFVDAVDSAIQVIAERPESGTSFGKNYRWIRLHRFPYLLYYRVANSTSIVVLAVAHERRRLAYWMKRDK